MVGQRVLVPSIGVRVPIPEQNCKDMKFEEKVYLLTKKIPRGKVATYKKIAERVGNPRSYRAVGNALNKNPHLVKVPCHRVVKSTGLIGGYALGAERKRKLLEKEGVEVINGGVDLAKYLDPQQE